MENNKKQSFWQYRHHQQHWVQSSTVANPSQNDSNSSNNNYSSRRNFNSNRGNNGVDSDFNYEWKMVDSNGTRRSVPHNKSVGGHSGGFNKMKEHKGEDVFKAAAKSVMKNINNNKNNNIDEKQEDTNDLVAKNIQGNKNFRITLSPAETVPMNQLAGYIFVCDNDTMQENLKKQLFGLPPRYRDSVRAITPGMPIFLYNYTQHKLLGIFEAASFGGTNIDSTAWEDKMCPGESRFPAQVQVITRKACKPLDEGTFRPIVHHYDGLKFRLELTLDEALSLLHIFADQSLDEIFKAIPA